MEKEEYNFILCYIIFTMMLIKQIKANTVSISLSQFESLDTQILRKLGLGVAAN